MAIRADQHMHSDFSGDSRTPAEEMILASIAKGLSHICLTEHYDPDFVYTPDEAGMFELDTDSYLRALQPLRERYQDKIAVRTGVELGLQPHLSAQLSTYAKSYGFDFIIGSSHLCDRMDPYQPAFFEGCSEESAHHRYFSSVLQCISAMDCFDVYGHLDYVVRYGPTKNDRYSYARHADLIDKILTCLIQKGKGLEVNTGGFRHGLGQPNPCTDILERYRALGGDIVTIGSDAHAPSDIASDFDRACDILKGCGFRYYCIFHSRVPDFVRL